uniref:Mediator of RNA polymerase II transcription subunit 25 n=1 Tax=Steinernema glaseri TaxID=37863 RepID=A0A1I8AJM7_9BILA
MLVFPTQCLCGDYILSEAVNVKINFKRGKNCFYDITAFVVDSLTGGGQKKETTNVTHDLNSPEMLQKICQELRKPIQKLVACTIPNIMDPFNDSTVDYVLNGIQSVDQVKQPFYDPQKPDQRPSTPSGRQRCQEEILLERPSPFPEAPGGDRPTPFTKVDSIWQMLDERCQAPCSLAQAQIRDARTIYKNNIRTSA